LQVTLKRLDMAFDAFFTRVKRGENPGYPRFKNKKRFTGWGYKTHGDGFKFIPGQNLEHGILKLSGIGEIVVRGKARTPGKIIGADITKKSDGWYLSLIVECEPHRERTKDKIAGLDWGVETFATLCYGPYKFDAVANDRIYEQEQEQLKVEQRLLSKSLRGNRTSKAEKQRKLLAKRWRKVSNRRKDRNHKTSAELVKTHAIIVTEDLSIKNMTASAKGTVEEPGKRVKQKAGLNRSILDTTPGSWLFTLRYKAEEADTQLILIDPRKYKPSQTDPVSGEVRRKMLSEREHTLPDGTVITRDQAAAWVLWNIGQELSFVNRETPSIAALAA